uniref:MmgE/PrpD family protein n=1 Tax=Bordetella sputigena TaxID=1416810 RepID=UPI0039F05D86
MDASPNVPIAVQLGRFVADVRADRLPARVVDHAKSRLLDCLATAISSRTLPVPAVAGAFVADSRGGASIVGRRERAAAVDASFVNATLVNGSTHDDFLAKSHAGAVVVPAALALAEEHGGSGADLLAAIVAGYEVTARAYLGGPGMLPRFRATGVPGAVGAAAAAARALRLDAARTANAIGLGAMFASGFGEGFHSGTMDVKLNVGWASRSGASAALLARAGATASPTVFEGTSGFFHAFSNGAGSAARTAQGLGEHFLIEETLYKERPVCIFVQTPVELAHRLAREHGFDPARIEHVRITAPIETYTNPGYLNAAPFATALKARISARFTVAAALLDRPIDTYAYYDRTDDADVLALAERIELVEPSSEVHDVHVEVTVAGRCFAMRGIEMEYQRPSHDKVVGKYRRLTADLAPALAEDILAAVLAMDRASDVVALTHLLRLV